MCQECRDGEAIRQARGILCGYCGELITETGTWEDRYGAVHIYCYHAAIHRPRAEGEGPAHP